MQIFANGIIAGLTISVLALAITSVYLPTRILHIALGGIYSVVPFIVLTGVQRGWGWYWSILIATVTGVALSLLCELLNHAPLENKRPSEAAHLVSSLGLYIITVQSVALIWGNETRMLRTGLDPSMIIGGLSFTRTQLISAAVSLVILLIFYLWLKFSRLGLQFRALADNPTEFALRGYNVRRFRLVAFGLAGFLCSVSAFLVSYDFGFNPYGGLTALLPAIVAVIVGGRSSFLGPAIGGLLIGVIRSETVWFLSSRWQNTATFFLLAIILFFRPNGLLGRKLRLEAEA